jgi:hypothetical protein
LVNIAQANELSGGIIRIINVNYTAIWLYLTKKFIVTDGKSFLASCSASKQYFIFDKPSTGGLFEGSY